MATVVTGVCDYDACTGIVVLSVQALDRLKVMMIMMLLWCSSTLNQCWMSGPRSSRVGRLTADLKAVGSCRVVPCFSLCRNSFIFMIRMLWCDCEKFLTISTAASAYTYKARKHWQPPNFLSIHSVQRGDMGENIDYVLMVITMKL